MSPPKFWTYSIFRCKCLFRKAQVSSYSGYVGSKNNLQTKLCPESGEKNIICTTIFFKIQFHTKYFGIHFFCDETLSKPNCVGSEIAYHNWTDCHFFSCPRGVILAPLGKIKQALIWYDWKDTCDDIKMSGPDKGQLISEWNFGVFKSSKMWTFFWQISALASKMGQIKKITAHYWANQGLFNYPI